MLKDFYKSEKIPDNKQIPLEKDILLTIPSEKFDIKPALKRLGLSKHEVAVTYPKEGVDMFSEVCAAEAKLFIQVSEKFFDEYLFMPDDESEDESLKTMVSPIVDSTYVCLHHHDEFSIKDGLGTVEKLAKLLKAQRQSFCCITNHGSVGGWIKQYNVCKKNKIKAIFGCEVYTSDYRGDDPEERKKHRKANHLVLIAKTMEGFYNIIKIHNDAQISGFYYSPRTNSEAIKKYGKGIIGSTACMKGEIPQLLMAGEKEKALERYKLYAEAFDEFYIEVQIIECEAQRETNRKLIEFAKEVGAPILLTCDSHYLEAEHTETHNIMMCIRQHKTLFDAKGEENEDVWNFDVKNLYYRNADQMREVFDHGFVDGNGTPCAPFKDDIFTEEVFNEAMLNTRKIAISTEDIKLDSTVKLPKLYEEGKAILRSKVNAGFDALGLAKKPNSKEYFDRVNYEFGVITKLGWTDYFLVMEKIIAEARREFGEWATGFGRGSAAGSLVSYCLGLTFVDPIQYGLLFERFLDESRPTPPDIDTDFDPSRREWVKNRIVEIFGSDHVCSIGTYQTWRTRAVILDVAGALGEDKMEVMEITKKIDPLDSFEDEGGEEKKVDKLTFDELYEHYPELKAYFEKHPEVRHHAEILRNQVKNMSTHAGGVIISDISLSDKIPVLFDKPSDEGRRIISAWAEAGGNEELSSVGLVKFDILGLNNLPVISDCIALIEKTKGEKITRADIPIDNREAIHFGSKADLVGIFQLDNPATKPVVDKVQIESLEDVAAVTSLIRPGPRDMGMDNEYAERKHGKDYNMPEIIKHLLADTYGVITYQEQCMKIAQVLAGFKPAESYKFLKSIAKKQEDLMASFKDKFIAGSQVHVDAGELTAEDVMEIWKLLEKFAGYGFNKSHAITYSAISTVELWLKYKHKTEYITALINNTKLGKKKHGEDIFVGYISYARRNGIEVLPPDVSKSKTSFTIEGGKILFSIGHIKNVASMASVIESFQPFSSIEDFHNRVKIESVGESGKKTSRRPNKKVVESLIESGAFSAFGSRNEVMAEYYKQRAAKKEIAPQHTDKEWIELEKEALGICLSLPPLYKQYEKIIADKKWKLISGIDNYKKVTVFGMIESITPRTSKTGNSMYMVKITDGVDSIQFYVFKSAQEYFKDHFKVGVIGGVPLDKFKDGDARFFNEHVECVVLPPPVNKASVPEVKSYKRDIKKFPDGTKLEFDWGGFDEWCVFYSSSKGRHAPKDVEYFTEINKLGEIYGKDKMYNDFIELHAATRKEFNPDLSQWITDVVSKEYGSDALAIDKLFTIIYAGMVAEENKKNAYVGKYMKLLGLFQVLIEGMPPAEAAKFTIKMDKNDINDMCIAKQITVRR